MESIPDWARELAVQLGFSDTMHLVRRHSVRHWYAMETDRDMGEWDVDLIGIPISDAGDDPANPPCPYAYADVRDGRARWYLRITTRVQRRGSLIFVEETVRADGRMRESIHGIQEFKTKTDLSGALAEVSQARAILGEEIARGGRPPRRLSPEEIATAYWNHADGEGKAPSQEALADEFYLSGRQFKEHLKRLRVAGELQWPPVRP